MRLQHPGKDDILRRLSIIDESGGKTVRMAHLATVGSHHVNGVAALHSELVKKDLFPEFAALWPEKFTNVTNGVTPRRWLALANPALHRSAVRDHRPGLAGAAGGLARLARPPERRVFPGALGRVQKLVCKGVWRRASYSRKDLAVDPDSLFDVQVKRIHEYKRQHLNALQVIHCYNRVLRGDTAGMAPRCVLIGGKAAPGYAMAKLIIRFINGIAEMVNADPDMDGRLRVVFLPDYNVKLGERVYPAADLSEQISTAGMEASGTGNMKFTMNGALTIGTLDGANVEIREQVGADNFFLFGKTTKEIADLRGGYRPWDVLSTLPILQEAFELIGKGFFSNGDSELFQPLLHNLGSSDPFFLLADFRDYMCCQNRVSRTWADRPRWNQMALLNTARSGFFSSDRSIRTYAETIWKVKPVPIEIATPGSS